jgi:hypothetical protein
VKNVFILVIALLTAAVPSALGQETTGAIAGRTQTVLDYDAFSDLQFNVPNPDFGRAGVSGVLAGQQFPTPRQVRIGVRFSL